MDLNDYQQLAMVTRNPTLSQEAELASAGLGIAGEAGEVADLVKKVLFHGHPLDEAVRSKLVKETGDVLWYAALLAEVLGVPLSDIAAANIVKLKARYPQGFEAARSLNRAAEG